MVMMIISIKIIKIFNKSLIKPLILLSENSTISCYPDIWKRSNIPVYKKSDKKLVKNFHPTAPLRISGKIIGKINLQ